jgi:hypothetical protein
MTAGTTTVGSCSGTTLSNTYTVTGAGCIEIDRSGTVGYNVDTVCVIVIDPITGIADTTVFIVSNTPQKDVIRDTNIINTIDTLCVGIEEGMTAGTTTVGSCSGTTLSNTYTVTGAGCIEIDRSGTVGYNVDTVCVIVIDPITGIADTTVFIVSNTPQKDVIRDTNIINTIDTLCVGIEEGMTAGTTTVGSCSGTTLSNTYTVTGAGCIEIDRSGTVGYNVDTVCVIVIDPITGIADTTVFIVSNTPQKDVIRDTNIINTIDTLCVGIEEGMTAGTTTVGSCSGTTLSNTYTVTGAGCIEIDRSGTVGYNVDTVCVIVIDPITGIADTTVVIVSNTPQKDVIRDTNIINTIDTLCVGIEEGMTAGTTTVGSCSGTTLSNTYTVTGAGCIEIDRSGTVGYNVDTVCVIVIDPITGIADTTVFIVSNTPQKDVIRDTNIINTIDTLCVGDRGRHDSRNNNSR